MSGLVVKNSNELWFNNNKLSTSTGTKGLYIDANRNLFFNDVKITSGNLSNPIGLHLINNELAFDGIKFGNDLNTLIRSLFANNEQGFAFDFNDLSTMYQDAAGTIPVTGVGQPVGLVLDKSKGLIKSEINRDVNFDNSSIWTIQATTQLGISVSNGLVSCNSTSNDRVVQGGVIFSANTRYVVEIDIVSYTRGDLFILIGGVEVYIPKRVGKHTVSFITTSTGNSISVYSGKHNIGGEWSVSSLSITSVSGNHATQSTSAKRPILQQNATTGAYYLAFDGVDDFLVTGNVDFSATSDMSLILGQDKLRNRVNYEFVMGTDGSVTQDGYLRIMNTNVNSSPVTQVEFRPQSDGESLNIRSSAVAKQILVGTYSLTNKLISLSINRSTLKKTIATIATGKFASKPIGLGASPNASWVAQCNMYSAIAISRVMTPTEITNTENAIAKNVGVTL